jgi:hypothetical protein
MKTLVCLSALAVFATTVDGHVLEGGQEGGNDEADVAGASADAPKLRGAAQAQPSKLWVVNNCGDNTALYFGAASKALDPKYIATGGSQWQESDGSKNPSIWVDKAGITGCFNKNCNAQGKSLAEFVFNPARSDWLDISFVEGFNYPVQIEVQGTGSVGQSPNKVACQDPSCKDSFMLCDTAAHNVEGGAPNWEYPGNAGLTYKVTFCHDSANTDNNNNSNRDSLQQTLPRYKRLPLPVDEPMVWCACSITWKLNPNVFNSDKYTQFTDDWCGPVNY